MIRHIQKENGEGMNDSFSVINFVSEWTDVCFPIDNELESATIYLVGYDDLNADRTKL